MYEGYCQHVSIKPWPLDPVQVSGFIRWLGFDVKYAVNSQEDVILPSLKRIHQEVTGEDVPQKAKDYMKNALRQVSLEGNLGVFLALCCVCRLGRGTWGLMFCFLFLRIGER